MLVVMWKTPPVQLLAIVYAAFKDELQVNYNAEI